MNRSTSSRSNREEDRLIPKYLWTAVSFFVIVAHLVILRGLEFRLILLFVLPVIAAVAVAQQDPATRSSRIAKIFLLLTSIGMIVAEVPWLFPQLGGVDPNLPQPIDRALTWYAAVYLIFFFCVCPIHLFTESLACHARGQFAEISVFTCWLGLFTASIMGIGTVIVAFA